MAIENNNLPNNPQSNVKDLQPFKKFCMTIGALPSSYLESLTYQELLLWFCDYLQNTVIPTINNNADAVEELQNLYIELKNYVDNYFKNLDVQEEINNKLDEMASDGTLENIINNNIFKELNNKITLNSENITRTNNNLNNKIINLQNSVNTQINNIKNATPIPVTSIDNMTDTSKIYVLTTDGNWYYYNGSNWVSGGVYQATQIPDNSIYTDKIKTIDISKINKLGFYVLPVSGAGTLSNSQRDSVLSLIAQSNETIGDNKSCFDMKIFIDSEINTFYGLFKIVGNNNDFIIQLPELNHTSIPTYKTGNYYSFQTNNENIINYINSKINDYITLRLEFTNYSGISVILNPLYFGNNKNTLNSNGFYYGLKPSFKNPKENLGIMNYDNINQKINFNFNNTTGLLYNYENIDITKDLIVEVELLEGDNIDVFFNWIDDEGKKHFYTDINQRITIDNNKRIIKKDYLSKNNITNAQIVLASIVDTSSNYNSTIKIPYILQFNYFGDLTKTFDAIYNSFLSYNKSNLFGKNIAVNGDSMAYGHTLPRNQVWDSLIANKNNMTLNNYAQNGKFITRNYFNNGVVTSYDEGNLPNNPRFS